MAKKRHRKRNPLRVDVSKGGKKIKTWLASRTPGELKREKKALAAVEAAGKKLKSKKEKSAQAKRLAKLARGVSERGKQLAQLKVRMKAGKKVGLKYKAKKISTTEYRSLMKQKGKGVKKIRSSVSVKKARENFKKFLAATKKAAKKTRKHARKHARKAAKKISKKGKKIVSKKKARKHSKKHVVKKVRKARKARKARKHGKKHVVKKARKARKHGKKARRHAKAKTFKFTMKVPRKMKKGKRISKKFKKGWRRFTDTITRKNPFGGKMDYKAMLKDIGHGQLAHRSYMDAGILVGAAAIHRPVSMYVAKYLPGYSTIATNVAKLPGGANLAAVLPGMIGAALLTVIGSFVKQPIVKKLADDVAAVNLVILGTAAGEAAAKMLPGLQGYPQLRGYPTMRGVDFTPAMNGVDFTPAMSGVPSLANMGRSNADFGRSSADFGANPDFGGVDFTPSMSGGDESMDFDPEDQDVETGEHLG